MPLLEMIPNYIFSFPTAVLILLIIKRFLPVPKFWRQVVLLLAASLIANPIIWLGDWANILFVAAVLFPAVLLLCGGQPIARFSVCLLLFSVIISVAAVLSHLRPPLDDYLNLLSILLWLCIYGLVRYFVKPEAVRSIRAKRWRMLDALAFLPFGVTFIIVLFSQPTRTYVTDDASTDTLVIGNESVLLILLALAAVYAVGLLLYVAFLARQERLEQGEMLWAIRQQHYTSLEENQLQVRRLRHDMANHLNAMAGVDDAAMRAYLARLIDTPAIQGGQRFCENDTVNAVLSGKWPVIEQEGIHAEIRIALPQDLPLSEVDLCAIFANCIDNAIEACRKCPPESRSLQLSARAEKGIFALRLKNSMAGDLALKDGVLVSTKADKENHGLGMAEIQDIVQSHDGTLRCGQEENCFNLQMSVVYGK